MAEWEQLLDEKILRFRATCDEGSESVGAQRAWLEGYLAALEIAHTIDSYQRNRYLIEISATEELANRRRKVH